MGGRFRSLVAAIAVAAGVALAAAGSSRAAEPRYACDRLSDAAVPMTQGADGWFFRGPSTDLAEFFPLDEEAQGLLRRLSGALAARGTRLVAMPVPPRGLVASDRLDPSVPEQALYSPTDAATEYRALVEALRRAGLAVADLPPDLIRGRLGPGFYLKRDSRWTPDGARLAAEIAAASIGRPGGRPVPIRPSGSGSVSGVMQAEINRLCGGQVPAESVALYKADAAVAPAGAPTIVVVGGDLAADSTAGFAAMLAATTGAAVIDRAIADSGATGALVAYLQSDAFAERPPAAILWQFMATDPLSVDTIALRQMIGAANGPCSSDGRLVATGSARLTGSGEVLTAPPSATALPGASLVLTFSGDPLQRFTIEVQYQGGDADAVSIEQAPPLPVSRRIFLALSGDFTQPVERIRLIGLPEEREVAVTAELCRARTGL